MPSTIFRKKLHKIEEEQNDDSHLHDGDDSAHQPLMLVSIASEIVTLAGNDESSVTQQQRLIYQMHRMTGVCA